MTDTKKNWGYPRTEEELLTEGWSLHDTIKHPLGAEALLLPLMTDNPELEFTIVEGDGGWEVKIMSRLKE
tara:strand:+ start:678 stop:887 length:210 start_codon:yes stop_codon:yes gene_type:complete